MCFKTLTSVLEGLYYHVSCIQRVTLTADYTPCTDMVNFKVQKDCFFLTLFKLLTIYILVII